MLHILPRLLKCYKEVIHLHCVDGDKKSEWCKLPFHSHTVYTRKVDFEFRYYYSPKMHILPN